MHLKNWYSLIELVIYIFFVWILFLSWMYVIWQFFDLNDNLKKVDNLRKDVILFETDLIELTTNWYKFSTWWNQKVVLQNENNYIWYICSWYDLEQFNSDSGWNYVSMIKKYENLTCLNLSWDELSWLNIDLKLKFRWTWLNLHYYFY